MLLKIWRSKRRKIELSSYYNHFIWEIVLKEIIKNKKNKNQNNNKDDGISIYAKYHAKFFFFMNSARHNGIDPFVDLERKRKKKKENLFDVTAPLQNLF